MAPSSVPRLLLALVLTVAAISSAAGQCSQCTSQCSAIKNGRGPCPYPPEDPSYSYFLFVLQWPGSFSGCKTEPQCCEGKFPQGVDWTIHGLWPEKSQDCYPYCCDLSSVKFSHKAIASLSDLRTYWPTLSCKNTDDSFHANEWDKHGTCALDALQALSSDPVHYYFQRTLQLREALPLARILSDQGIVPADDQTYSTADVISAIRDFTKATPDLDCIRKSDILDEVHFCIDTDLQTYIDCPTGSELAAKATFDMVTRGHGGGGGGHGGRKKGCPDAIRIPIPTFGAAVV